jgi:UDP-N-acetylmuramoyl-tripeptide--D-alanyl-D-alanine ligase
MTLAQAASWMGGALEAGAGDLSFEKVSIDSRTLEAGQLFFAIIGPNHDGHRFIEQAFERGAIGVVASKETALSPSAARAKREPDERGARRALMNAPEPLIRVSDTTRALQDLAAMVRQESGMKVVAITGSMGKTTTKEATALALGGRFRVLKSEKNLNNEYGLPLSILRHHDENVGVFELGMSAPGELARLTEIAKPDVGVLTNVAEVHREFFPSLEAIARAKGELFDGLPDEAVSVVNADDPLVLSEARRFAGRQIRFGLHDGADVRVVRFLREDEGIRFSVRYEDQEAEVRAPVCGKHNVYNLLAALTVAVVLGLPLAVAAMELAELTPPPHRGQRVRLGEGIVIIDETYNSNPAALGSVLESFAEERARRRVAVLGDMLELGDRAEVLHRESGRKAAQSGLDLLIGVGPLGRFIVQEACRAGMSDTSTLFAETAADAAELLADRIESGDIVLLKASRGVGLDHALDVLRARFGVETI